jgi:hypothetical protein
MPRDGRPIKDAGALLLGADRLLYDVKKNHLAPDSVRFTANDTDRKR